MSSTATPAQGVEGVVTSNHKEWLTQGGDAPEAPAIGMKQRLHTIDYQQPSRDTLRQQIARALSEDGFFVLTNHTVPPQWVESMLTMARRFFLRLRDDAEGKRKKVAEKIRMNEMLRPMTKAARGFSFFEDETLNAFMGADQKFTFDYALQNDAAFIGRRAAFEKEAAALQANGAHHADREEVDSLTARYQRLRTCAEHLGKNLWPEEETHAEAELAKARAREATVTASLPPQGRSPFFERNTKSDAELDAELRAFADQVAAESVHAKAPEQFRATCERYLADLFPLSQDLLTLILEGAAGLTADTVEVKVKPLFADPLVIHRLISYPPQRTPLEVRQSVSHNTVVQTVMARAALGDFSMNDNDKFGAAYQQEVDKAMHTKISMSCGSHVDYGALTMIAEDSGKALEIERRGAPGQYEYLPEVPKGALIVSTGFMLEKLTNGKIPATRHRVQNVVRKEDLSVDGLRTNGSQTPVTRTALAFFLDPHPEAFIEPLPECIDALNGETAHYEGCIAGAKGVRFGDPRYLSQIVSDADRTRRQSSATHN